MMSLPDLDYPTALANMAGMEALYQEALQAFWDEAPSLIAEYHQQLAAARYAEARRAAHSLKSAAAVLGAMRLSQAARELEMLARDAVSDPQQLEPACQACDQAWQTFTVIARPYLPA